MFEGASSLACLRAQRSRTNFVEGEGLIMKVGIMLFDEVDVLDAGGPYEVFLTASRLSEREGRAAPFEIFTVGVSREPVVAYGGLRLVPQLAIDEAEGLDALVVPGAIAIDRVMGDSILLDRIRAATMEVPVVSSVCTGAFILGELGLLAGRAWTTHWEDVESLSARVGDGGQSWTRWVDTGEIVTSGGLSSRIAMALHLVDRLAGRDLAVRTATQIEYDWDPESGVSAAPN
jgi:transcriptional regulator GlxA family with amidase domain